MRTLSILSLATAVAFAVPAWKPLFNGKTFEPEWKIVGDKKYWSIDPLDSSIAGYAETRNPEATMLFTKTTYDQFTVKYSYRLKAGCSGFFFRSKEAAASPYVTGCQVEAKFEGGLKEFGSVYCHPTPGWVRETDPKFVAYAARAADQYQDVILTVKTPNVYVNVNGKQALGAGAAGQAAGGKAAWDYSGSQSATPGLFGLQIHEQQPKMDVHFKNIMILTGCGETASPRYDGATVAGLPEQPAIYQDNGTCIASGIGNVEQAQMLKYIGSVKLDGNRISLNVSYPGEHTLEIVSLRGKVVFSGSAPIGRDYQISSIKNHGIYVARIKTKTQFASKRIVIP
jgi:hypothetical protein